MDTVVIKPERVRYTENGAEGQIWNRCNENGEKFATVGGKMMISAFLMASK